MKPLITVVIPVLIQEKALEELLATTKKSIELLYQNTAKPFNLLIIDSGSCEEAARELRNLSYPRLTISRHEERTRGMVEAINEAWKSTDTDLLTFMHNDFYILGTKWDLQASAIAKQDPKLGIIGFGGGYGLGPTGERHGFASNMVDAHVHGAHRWEGWMPTVVLDGMIMIMSRKMLDATQGIPAEYKVHHFYDRQMSLASIYAGFRNYILFIRCRHIGAQTRMTPELDNMEIYRCNEELFLRLWSNRLPVYVTHDFRFQAEDSHLVWI